MAKIYRDINIQVNFGVGPTMFIGQSTNVMTENEIARLLIVFPATYSDYTKVIDISYTSSEGTPLIESYAISYDDDLASYYFIVERKFTYNKKLYMQFRARHPTGQEIVDPYKLSLNFKDAIKKTNLEELENGDASSLTVTLQNMVNEHAALQGSTIESGHFRIDGTTLVSIDGVLHSYSQSSELPIHAATTAGTETLGHVKIDNETIFIDEDGVISASATTVEPIIETLLCTPNSYDQFEQYVTGVDDITGLPVFIGKEHSIMASKINKFPFVFRAYNFSESTNGFDRFVGWRSVSPDYTLSEQLTKVFFEPKGLKLNREHNTLFFEMNIDGINPAVQPGEDIMSVQEVIDWGSEIFGTEVAVVKKPAGGAVIPLITIVEISADVITRLQNGTSKGLVFRPVYTPIGENVSDYLSIGNIYITHSGIVGDDNYKSVANPIFSNYLSMLNYYSVFDVAVNDNQILLAATAYNDISINALIGTDGVFGGMAVGTPPGFYSSRAIFLEGEPYIATLDGADGIHVYSFAGTEIAVLPTGEYTYGHLGHYNERFDAVAKDNKIFVAYHTSSIPSGRAGVQYQVCLSVIEKTGESFSVETVVVHEYAPLYDSWEMFDTYYNTPTLWSAYTYLPVSISFDGDVPVVAFGIYTYLNNNENDYASDIAFVRCGTELEVYVSNIDNVVYQGCGLYGYNDDNKFIDDLLIHNGIYYFIYVKYANNNTQQRFLCSYNPSTAESQVLWTFPTNFLPGGAEVFNVKNTLYIENGYVCSLFLDGDVPYISGYNSNRRHFTVKILKYPV